jgi:DNA anti-recombination protein RmuC
MMRRFTLIAAALVLGAAPAWSQQTDTTRPGREEMRRRLDEHFTTRVRDELGLDEKQTVRLRETATTFGGRRRELETRERAVRDALESQLRPGIAANRDSVARLTDQLVEMRLAYAQTFRDEHREISKYLDPVQRARLYMMRERLMRRVHEVRDERGPGREFHGRRRPMPPPRQPGDSV